MISVNILPYENYSELELNKFEYSEASTFDTYFKGRKIWLKKGREAIEIILSSLNISKSDEVFITTSSESQYVSSCVTSTVFNYCKPSRELSNKTKVILIIHEFGVPHPKTIQLCKYAKKNQIIVIEDCAHTINSLIDNKYVGTYGDFSFYSFSKLLPVSEGGLLVQNNFEIELNHYEETVDVEKRNLIMQYIHYIPSFSKKRVENYNYLKDVFRKYINGPYIEINKNVIPYYFSLPIVDSNMSIRNTLQKKNIYCGTWFGKNYLLIPIHQFLNKNQLDYLINEILRQLNYQ